jgi:hypothetical protein
MALTQFQGTVGNFIAYTVCVSKKTVAVLRRHITETLGVLVIFLYLHTENGFRYIYIYIGYKYTGKCTLQGNETSVL